MDLVAYLRVSTDAQVDRYGLAAQRADLDAWADANGHRLVAYCADEGVSGTVEAVDRPGLAAALNALESGEAEGLAVAKLDRLARHLTIQEAALAHIWQRGGAAYSVDAGQITPDDEEDPMRTAMRQMMGVFAQLERAMIVQRMKKGRAAKAAQGGYAYGSPPLGWRAEGGGLVADPDQQATLRRIVDLSRQGLSTRQICDVLERDGLRTKRGHAFSSATVARVLRRELGRLATSPS